MAVLTWDQVGERTYEAGVDRGVLYVPTAGVYDAGYAWNGLISVNEQPSGAEPSAYYANNSKYLTLLSAEDFAASLEAYTYPDEFMPLDGFASPVAGVHIGQQSRGVFGLSYRSMIGNDSEGESYAYKLHLVYGCQASPSERQYSSINESPEPNTLSWELSTTPVSWAGGDPTAILTVDSRTADPTQLSELEDLLYGTVATEPSLPLPDAVVTLLTP